MKRTIQRFFLCLCLCVVAFGPFLTGCDFRKYYHGYPHDGNCGDKDCEECKKVGNGFPRTSDAGIAPTVPDTLPRKDDAAPNPPEDRFQCLQQCYDQGHDKNTCQTQCNGSPTVPDQGGSQPGDTTGSNPPDTSTKQPEIDQDAYNSCWTDCKQKGELDCICESRCRSMARGVWVAKCWESCAKSEQDLAVCKKKCDA